MPTGVRPVPATHWASFAHDAASVPKARHVVRTVLDGAGLDEMALAEIEIVVSEIVGNAVRHAQGDVMQVRLRRTGNVLRIAVHDRSSSPPAPREASFDDESGRGMMIIGALSSRWGWEPRPDGKVVWADVAC